MAVDPTTEPTQALHEDEQEEFEESDEYDEEEEGSYEPSEGEDGEDEEYSAREHPKLTALLLGKGGQGYADEDEDDDDDDDEDEEDYYYEEDAGTAEKPIELSSDNNSKTVNAGTKRDAPCEEEEDEGDEENENAHKKAKVQA